MPTVLDPKELKYVKALPKTRSFVWKGDRLLMLDQRLLPHETAWRTCRTWADVAKGIREMVIRGAPAIGCAAAYGMVLAARAKKFKSLAELRKALEVSDAGLLKARPTAVNLKWALEKMRNTWSPSSAFQAYSPLGRKNLISLPLPKGEDGRRPGEGTQAVTALLVALERQAIAIEEMDRESNRAIGRYGADLFSSESVIITHCNTGSLATAGLGTAFGVLWTAFHDGKIKKVIASETRPYLQGARLTAWELQQEKIPFELITDNMAAHLMDTEKIDAVIVGADRIAANGDTANKIGTYSLAVLAAHHHIPFYVAAPVSTIDLKTAAGRGIPIEERSMEEVTEVRGHRIAPKNVHARHPAFDVTPAPLIHAIITEHGVARAPFGKSLARIVSQAKG